MTSRKKAPEQWRNAIVRYADEDPASLLANPQNWRTHPASQTAALKGSLGELGWIAPVIVNETTQHVVDGHARIGEAIARGEATVPVAYVQLTEAQERLALATFDPIAALAGQDGAQLAALLDGLKVSDAGLADLLASLGPLTDPQGEWDGMPAFEQDDQLGGSAFALIVHFKSLADKQAFGKLIGQSLTERTKYVWHPEEKPSDRQSVRWTDEP